MLHAGYQLMRSALLQQIPDKTSCRNRRRGGVLVNCRGGRSRSVALVALFMHPECPQRFPARCRNGVNPRSPTAPSG
jgi:myo-inositol-1(or 4)-monophosphatase